MTGFVFRRLLATLPVVPIVAVLIFVLIHLGGSDPARIMAGDTATEASVEALRKALALDRPLYEQFLAWTGGLLRGDLGTSIFYQRPVTDIVAMRLGPTVSLALVTLCFAALVGIPLGAYAASRSGSLVDRLITGAASIGFSIPIFLTAYTLVYVFAVQLRWLPAQGYVPLSEGITPFLRALILPMLTLGSFYVALFARVTRATVLDVLKQDFIRTARAKGASTGRVLFLHALRNSAVPVLTVVGTTFAGLMGGVVVTESLFNIPGLGRLVTEAILKRDFPVIQGLVLMLSVFYVLVNLAIDLLYAILDPRIRQ